MLYQLKLHALTWSVALTGLGLVGCSDPELKAIPTTPDEEVHPEQAFMNVGTHEEITRRFAEGAIEMRPGYEFKGVLLHVTSFERFELEMAYERLDGSLSEFFPVEPDEPEYPVVNASAILPERAQAIVLRAVEGGEAVEFLAARFYEEIPADEALDIHYDEFDPAYEVEDELSPMQVTESGNLVRRQGLAGRYVPSDEALAKGGGAGHRYEGAPAWNRSACGGSFLPGTRDLAEYLMKNFNATHYGGYSCRQNTANASKMSVHGTGRAIDLHYNLVRGDADNGKGDPTANWLIANAAQTGVQLVIWDRTSWSVSRKTHRKYTGPHPHHDHHHIEVNAAAARRELPFFKDPSVTSTPQPGSTSSPGGPTTGSGGTGGVSSRGFGLLGQNLGSQGSSSSSGNTCISSTLGRRVAANTCVQMAYPKYGGRCNWARCSSSGFWTRATGSTCPGASSANATCGGQNPLPSASGDPSMPTDPDMPYPKGNYFDKGALTYYYLALEEDFPGAEEVALEDCAGGEIKQVSQAFLDAVTLKGSGKLKDGRVVDAGSGASCFEVLDEARFPWGKGSSSKPLKPFRSIAMETSAQFLPGGLIYISEFDGVQTPELEGVPSFKHDGCFRIDEVGEGIQGNAVDLFAGTEEASEELMAKVDGEISLHVDAHQCAHIND